MKSKRTHLEKKATTKITWKRGIKNLSDHVARDVWIQYSQEQLEIREWEWENELEIREWELQVIPLHWLTQTSMCQD